MDELIKAMNKLCPDIAEWLEEAREEIERETKEALAQYESDYQDRCDWIFEREREFYGRIN